MYARPSFNILHKHEPPCAHAKLSLKFLRPRSGTSEPFLTPVAGLASLCWRSSIASIIGFIAAGCVVIGHDNAIEIRDLWIDRERYPLSWGIRRTSEFVPNGDGGGNLHKQSYPHGSRLWASPPRRPRSQMSAEELESGNG